VKRTEGDFTSDTGRDQTGFAPVGKQQQRKKTPMADVGMRCRIALQLQERVVRSCFLISKLKHPNAMITPNPVETAIYYFLFFSTL
jgi:hypothetical protein